MKFKASQIAEILNGVVDGNPDAVVHKLSKIEEGTKGSLTFLAHQKYLPYIYKTNASIVIVERAFKPDEDLSSTLIRVDDPRKAFSVLLEHYDKIKSLKIGVEPHAFIAASSTYGENFYAAAFSYISENVSIGNNVKIYSHVFIGENVSIGDDVVIYPGAKICQDTILGSRCTIQCNAVVGDDGFGYAPLEDGSYKKVPQTGNVIIEDDVEVGSATTIDRATLGSTIIRKGVKLDNQIQIAHNVEIGEHTVIAAQTGIAGSTKIGKHCRIGGQVGIAGHITIGNYVQIQAQSGIGRNLKDHEVLQGSPALAYNAFNKSYVHFKNLQDIVSRIDTLEKSNDNRNK
ncbi:MAG: UDP-3-O-(3-hydroxymyristoyl)glucosamine N-acyltransferase [Flavobacteriaceae bacterium]|nr:UDP-3-O-(3-hydroxymyristoyl)glucosamine N-acyltransferase [Flavobacteriaceae bacterium]